ncbi:MAG: hypothetical protein JOY54_21220 [Acidobacteriaceae bacterium]|nr:hypothetical protein [Acidobacteriaceae bacterium]
MSFDSALNLVWLLLGAIALICTIRARARRPASQRIGPPSLHIVGVTLIAAALFPYISATDDVLRVQNLERQHDAHHPGQAPAKQSQKSNSQNQDLMRLYETIDTPLVCRIQEISLLLCFISLVIAPVVTRIDRSAPSESGRSPPQFLPA